MLFNCSRYNYVLFLLTWRYRNTFPALKRDFSKLRSQLIAASIVIAPAILAILQSETGLALVYFSFFLVMFRRDYLPLYWSVGFSFAILVVATLLVDPNILSPDPDRHCCIYYIYHASPNQTIQISFVLDHSSLVYV